MRFYTTPHRYYCGIDLHARRMYICVLDAEGQIRVHRNGPATPEHFLTTIAPYREGLVVAVECIFTWYWLADLCAQERIAFVLGHALYMKAIHGGKAKNDKIDAHKIAVLLRGGMLPMAYVYPREMRATRDLLRRRCHFTRKRAELLTHIQNTASQYLLPALGKIAYHGNRVGVAEQFSDPAVRKSIETNLALVDHYDRLLTELELHLTRTAKVHDVNAFYRLRSVPGIGKILALVLLYEIHDILEMQSTPPRSVTKSRRHPVRALPRRVRRSITRPPRVLTARFSVTNPWVGRPRALRAGEEASFIDGTWRERITQTLEIVAVLRIR
jgi:transposase